MQADSISHTAMATSLMRAAHVHHTVSPLINDSWADQLVPDFEIDYFYEKMIETSPELKRLNASKRTVVENRLAESPAYGEVLMRTRYTLDALDNARAEGVSQYVIIGAGMDGFSLSTINGYPPLVVYEIDHRNTQRLKLRQLNKLAITPANNVRFIEADLSQVSVSQALQTSDIKHSQPIFYSWLGVSMYLSREANLTTLSAIRQSSAPGSELVFSYIDNALFSGGMPGSKLEEMKEGANDVGEPWLSGFTPKSLQDDLAATGWRVVENLSTEALLTRYEDRVHEAVEAVPGMYIARVRVA